MIRSPQPAEVTCCMYHLRDSSSCMWKEE